MKSEKEKMLAGMCYNPGDAQLLERWHEAKRLTVAYNRTTGEDRAEQDQILTALLGGKGANLWITPPFYCDYGNNITIGNNTEINMNCVFLDCNRITIGGNVLLGPSVQLYTAYHPVRASERIVPADDAEGFAFSVTQAAPIAIGDNVWIGGGSIILPGVTIGDNTTIGAGSVVTRSIPANVLAVGNPCRVIRQL